MAPQRGSGSRLSADDWIQAGFALLADGGPNALHIDPLCARLEVTKGSFYWHFADLRSYRTALVEAWGSLRDENRRSFENMAGVDPRERLAVMMQTMVASKHWALERTMRVWAMSDDAVLANVQRSDGGVLRAVRQAFTDHGFAPEDAALRAAVVFAAGVGLLHVSSSAREVTPELLERLLDFMFRP
jgi:AcrR family transcriptional regulator